MTIDKIRHAIKTLTDMDCEEELTSLRYTLKIGKYEPLELGYDKSRKVLSEEQMRWSAHCKLINELSNMMMNDYDNFMEWQKNNVR